MNYVGGSEKSIDEVPVGIFRELMNFSDDCLYCDITFEFNAKSHEMLGMTASDFEAHLEHGYGLYVFIHSHYSQSSWTDHSVIIHH